MAEISLWAAEELDKRRKWKEGDPGVGQERRCSASRAPSTVSALGRRAQEEAAAGAALKIGPKEMELARRCLEPKSSSDLPATDGFFSV